MSRLRRAAAAAVCMTLGAAVVATPAWAAAPPAGARPDAVNSADDARPGQTVPKDAKGRRLVYVEGPSQNQLRAAVVKAGGTVSGSGNGRIKAAVPQEKLDLVASQPGVTEVRLPDRAVPMAVTSEGVAAAKANLWHDAGKKGAGVKVGIIDVGFGDVAASQASGDLPANITINNDNCLDAAEKSPHGTGIAEIVHDVAPEAQLFLACIEDTFSFDQAETWLRAQGVQVISSAIGFLAPAGSRGDGTGDAGSPAEIVKRSKAANILWSVAAGNQARLHYGGNAIDANADGWVEFGASRQNGFPLDPGRSATVGLRWDAWPKTKQDLDLYVMKSTNPPNGPNDPEIVAQSTRSQKDSTDGLAPTESLTFTNNLGTTQTYWVYVKNHNAALNTPMDLFVSGPANNQQLQYYTEAGSVVEPATSPHVIAVGATAPGSGRVQDYSGRGPTVDGRTKPDITGYDEVSTSAMGVLRGTSAAAGHVAGAAALFKSANPSLDASQLQTALLNAANPKQSNNNWGNGPLSVGTPGTPAAPAGAGFTSDATPTRVFDQEIPANETRTLAFPSLPGDTTAVAITVSAQAHANDIGDFAIEVGTGDLAAKGGRVPTLYARGDNAWTWQTLTFFAPLDSARSIKLRNRGNGPAGVVVERLGYFSPQQSTDTYVALPAPARLLDTRGYPVAAGGNPRNTSLDAGGDKTAEVQIRGVAGIPQNAQAVVANLTGFEATEQQFLTAHGTTAVPGVTSVSVAQGDRRTNTVVVPIGPDGKIRVTNSTWRSVVGASLDVVGYFGPGNGAKYVPLTDSSRVADTATGNGVPRAQIGHGQVAQFQVSGVAGVAATATTAAVVLTGNDNNIGTELSAVASEVGWTAASQVVTRKLETGAGLALVPLGDSGKVDVRNERGQTRLSADVTGYFVGGGKVATPAVAGNCVTSRDEPGFGSAFDGRTESGTRGWLSTGQAMTADGCELRTADSPDVNWYTPHTYGNDYTLKLDWKAETEKSDSGVYVLMPNPGNDAGKPNATGYEIQIKQGGDQWVTGSVVGRQAPTTTSAAKPVGQWNTYEIKVSWNSVTVYLNGQRVNDYTSPDATQTERNTFIGLQNDNTGDAVKFRNVRIRQDTPVWSGTLKSGNGRCLDIKWADPAQQVAWMFDCHGQFAQTWASNEGMIQGAGRCLMPDTNNDGAQVLLVDCVGDARSQWVRRTDGRLVNRATGLCATPAGASQEARLVMSACAPSRTEQVWTVPEQRGRVGKVVGPGGRCLDVFGHNPAANQAVLWGCNSAVAQQWVAPGDGTLRGEGKCLNVNGGTAEGTAVAILDCNAQPAQQWVAQADGTLLNPISGRCLTSASTADGAALSITNCAARNTQLWRQTAVWASRGPVVGPQTRCLDVYAANPSANTVVVWGCHGGFAQDWRMSGDGTIEAYNNCLDISGTGNNAPVTLPSNCQRTGGQVWAVRSDGSIVNPVSGRCLDGKLGADGDRAIVFDCHGGLPQRFATAVNGS
ncbi:ricin-type beta-trefoil lectin domain protein [Lentzea sp. NPDC005914]|uniref:ricin-type beta-trefoil lectin domain protein n=1 Tax=Lentzea sp. NPDC005914 TaxID=3154572 RepID=UPI0033F3F8EC